MSNPVRFHISLNVADLAKSVAFFRTLLGVEPAKLRADYAKFEPDTPPLVLSLEPARGEISRTGALNHAGFRLPDVKTLVAMQERLERAGMPTKRESGVECCYAKQTKFWAHDPDGNLWEVYTFDGDIEHRGDGQSEQVVSGKTCSMPNRKEPVVWEHFMTQPVPSRIPLEAATADEVRLRGTLNLPLSINEREAIVAEAVRVLKPGGRVFVHVLTGESSIENPELPGPAGKVQSVPFESDPGELLESAGFVGVKMLKFDTKPCFVRNGVGMRETQVEAFVPSEPGEKTMEVMYKGPFREVRDDEGRVFPRGRRVTVPATIAHQLQSGELANQFTVFESAVRLETLTACGN